METKKTKDQQNKKLFFDKINKIDKPLASIAQKKREKAQSQEHKRRHYS